jgi:hypothetical protein
MPTDERQAAAGKIAELLALLKNNPGPGTPQLIEETEALGRAIAAFHMEGIRFRIYNVDRLVHHSAAAPAGASALLEDARRHLEAAGFHTRSHQAPS